MLKIILLTSIVIIGCNALIISKLFAKPPPVIVTYEINDPKVFSLAGDLNRLIIDYSKEVKKQNANIVSNNINEKSYRDSFVDKFVFTAQCKELYFRDFNQKRSVESALRLVESLYENYETSGRPYIELPFIMIAISGPNHVYTAREGADLTEMLRLKSSIMKCRSEFLAVLVDGLQQDSKAKL